MDKNNEGVLDECGLKVRKEGSKWKPGNAFITSMNTRRRVGKDKSR